MISFSKRLVPFKVIYTDYSQVSLLLDFRLLLHNLLFFKHTVPFKVIYTDYSQVALVYACGFLNDQGECRRPGEQVSLLSRTKSLPDNVYTHVYDVMEASVCVDKDDFVKADMSGECKVL